MQTKPKLSFRMAALATVFFESRVGEQPVGTYKVLDAINREASNGNCQPMTIKQVSDALANLKLLGCVISRPDPENKHSHLWSVTSLGGRCIDNNGFTEAYDALRAKDTTAVQDTQPTTEAVVQAAREHSAQKVRRITKPTAPIVTACVVFSFNGTKYTLPLEVIKAIKEFTL